MALPGVKSWLGLEWLRVDVLVALPRVGRGTAGGGAGGNGGLSSVSAGTAPYDTALAVRKCWLGESKFLGEGGEGWVGGQVSGRGGVGMGDGLVWGVWAGLLRDEKHEARGP